MLDIINKKKSGVIDLLPYLDFEDQFALFKITIFNQQIIWNILNNELSLNQTTIAQIELSQELQPNKEQIFVQMIQLFWQERHILKQQLFNQSKELLNLYRYFLKNNLPLNFIRKLLIFLTIEVNRDLEYLSDSDSDKSDQFIMYRTEAFDLSWKSLQFSHLLSVLAVVTQKQIAILEILFAIISVNDQYQIIYEDRLVEKLYNLNLYEEVNSQLKKYSQTELIINLLINLLPVNFKQNLNLQQQINAKFLNSNEIKLLQQISVNRNDKISVLLQQVFKQMQAYSGILQQNQNIPNVEKNQSLQIVNTKSPSTDHISVQSKIPIPTFLPFLTHKSDVNQFCVKTNKRFMTGLIHNPQLEEFNKKTKIVQYIHESAKMDLESYSKYLLDSFQKPYKNLQQAKIQMMVQLIYEQREKLSNQLRDIFQLIELKKLIRNLKQRQAGEQTSCYTQTSKLLFLLAEEFEDINEDLTIKNDKNTIYKNEIMDNKNNVQPQINNFQPNGQKVVRLKYFQDEIASVLLSEQQLAPDKKNGFQQELEFSDYLSNVDKLFRILLNQKKSYPTLLLYLKLNHHKNEIQINITSQFIEYLNQNNFILNIVAKVCQFNKSNEVFELQNLSEINLIQLSLDPKKKIKSYQSILVESIILVCKQVYTYYDVLREIVKCQNYQQFVKDLKQVKSFDSIYQPSKVLLHLNQMQYDKTYLMH